MPIIAILAAAAATVATPATTADRDARSVTANYSRATGLFCLRTGAQEAFARTGRPVRTGECHSGTGWRELGITFDTPLAPGRMPMARSR